MGNVEVLELDLERILDVINVSWAQGTRNVYGASLLVYHIFCDLHSIPKKESGPAFLILVIAFISSCTWYYVGNTLAKNVFAIWAWHILCGLSWSMDVCRWNSNGHNCPGTTNIQAYKEDSSHSRTDGAHLWYAHPLRSTGCCCHELFLHNLQSLTQGSWQYLLSPHSILHGMSNLLTEMSEEIIMTWKSWYFTHQRVKIYFGHSKKVSQTLKPCLRITSRSTFCLLRVIYLHTSTTEASVHWPR